MSESSGEREMLWEYESQASVSTVFLRSPKFSQVILYLDRTQRTCFLFLLENTTTKKENNLITLMIKESLESYLCPVLYFLVKCLATKLQMNQ